MKTLANDLENCLGIIDASLEKRRLFMEKVNNKLNEMMNKEIEQGTISQDDIEKLFEVQSNSIRRYVSNANLDAKKERGEEQRRKAEERKAEKARKKAEQQRLRELHDQMVKERKKKS